MNLKSFLTVVAALYFTACASKRVQLVSDPPAKVYVSSSFSSEFKELGQTPLSVNLKEHASASKFTYFSFKSDGYDNYRMVLPINFGAGTVEVKLNEQQKVTDEELEKEIEEKLKNSYETQIAALNNKIKLDSELHSKEQDRLEQKYKEKATVIFNKVMEVQNALHIKKMPKAAKAIAELRTLGAPDSLLLTLEGNFEFIRGRYSRAIASYTRALEIDPQNVELAGILKDLKKVVK